MPQASGAPAYVVAAVHHWNREVFEQKIKPLPGDWHVVDRPEELTPGWLESVSPQYVFFLRWSWKVPPETAEHSECVALRMTDVPHERGGSDLLSWHRRVSLCATVRQAFAGKPE